jgi:tetratricopeptide (TPR) repeat protein
MNKADSSSALADIRQAHYLIDKGKHDEALAVLDRLKRQATNVADLTAAIGDLCARLGEQALAINYLLQAQKQAPDDVPLMARLANAYLVTGQLQPAEEILSVALARDPDNFEVIRSLAIFSSLRQDYPSMRKWSEKAVALRPNDVDSLINLSLILAAQGEPEMALEHALTARRLAVKDVRCYLNLSRVYVFLDRKDEAQRQLEKALEIDPLCGPACEQLATMKKWTSGDQPFISKIEARLNQGMTIQSRAAFHYALGKMYDNLGQYDKAFDYFRKANIYFKPQKQEYDDDLLRKQKKLCTRRYLESLPSDNTSDIPVFVVGMPRSGTSLIEQIIASHPDAAGAGELQDMLRLSRKLLNGANYRDSLLGRNLPDRATLDALREEYLAALRKHGATARRIVDKMPENFYMLGVIAALFPKAKIIHVRRHPLDTCLSCYFQMFEQLFWSFDLKWIAEAYCRYRDAMAYWEKTLPPGRLLHVDYENLIEHPEEEIRRLLAHIGLEWDPACLDFASSRRAVRTVSVWQVRQPLYKTSRHRWMNYAPHISDLANDLAAYLQSDREILRQHGVTLK